MTSSNWGKILLPQSNWKPLPGDKDYLFQCPISFTIQFFSDLAKLYHPGNLLGVADLNYSIAQLPKGQFYQGDVIDVIPTTEFQERLMREDDVTYTQLYLRRFVDPERVEASCRTLVHRHAILRTVVIQVVLRDLNFSLVRLSSDEDLFKSADEACAQDTPSPILLGAPHFKPFLMSRSRPEHILIIRMSRAGYDGASFRFLPSDLADAYKGHELNSTRLPFPIYL
ncbi:hypothetical protein ETB97_004217 [Aspergillus alliaceus]|uniref:Uncharacterized protein n=1 Tax=Petromyces alliaceus TaxID=209559 RepID=A0A8H6AEM4_PETAA|nr:hypothetical protein ETB97_004217 [Aspergillus burnettii]